MNEKNLARALKISFSDLGLLRNALIHRSYLNEHTQEKGSNERLEYLGDAVLEYLVSKNLFVRFPSFDEGKLTATRAKLVNTQNLAKFAKEHSLGSFLYLSKGEEESGGRTSTSLLANTVEAIIGALYLDSGIDSAEKFVTSYILQNIDEIIEEGLKDPKSSLQETVQSRGLPPPVYKTVSSIGPDHNKVFEVEVLSGGEVLGVGSGKSKQEAQQKAAEEALKRV